MCSGKDKSFDEISDQCQVLTGYGVQPRYPLEIEISARHVLHAIESIRIIKGFETIRKIYLDSNG